MSTNKNKHDSHKARHPLPQLLLAGSLLILASCQGGGGSGGAAGSNLDPDTDYDGDGWTLSSGDCCESGGCSNPVGVNPGAFEIPDNGVDDDCDVLTPDTGLAALCSTAAKFGAVTGDDMANAMDLCQTTTIDAARRDAKWGLISAELLGVNGNALSPTEQNIVRDRQTAILENFGSGGISPRNGQTMAGMSSGWMRDTDDPDYVAGNNTTFGRSNVSGPGLYLAANGGSYPAAGNCPSGSGANDAVNLRLTIRVPTNAYALAFDQMYMSSEYLGWSCTNYNDISLALLQSSSPFLPADRNISYDINGDMININSSYIDVCDGCAQSNAALTGTGLEAVGGATRWLTTTAAVEPGEVIVLDLMLFDVTDALYDSQILYDNFRWVFQDPGDVPETVQN